jgi:hypothetical protein
VLTSPNGAAKYVVRKLPTPSQHIFLQDRQRCYILTMPFLVCFSGALKLWQSFCPLAFLEHVLAYALLVCEAGHMALGAGVGLPLLPPLSLPPFSLSLPLSLSLSLSVCVCVCVRTCAHARVCTCVCL